MATFKEDVRRMDFIKDLFEARLAVGETNPKEGITARDYALGGKLFKANE